MSSGIALAPKVPRNLKATAIVSVALVAACAVSSLFFPWHANRGPGLVFGFLAAFLFAFEMLYPWRRRLASRFLNTARNWLQAHVYLGVITLVSVFIHAGFRWPTGALGWSLMMLSVWTTLTGLLGVWLQKWIPSALADGLTVEVLYERIPAILDKLRTEAETLVENSSDRLKRFYDREARQSMGSVSGSWGYLFNVAAGRERALEKFRRMSQFVDPSEQDRVEDLMTIYTEKLELDAQYSLQSILRRWQVLHVPAAGLLIGLLVVHIAVWIVY